LNGFDLNISTEEPDENAMNIASDIAKGLTNLENFRSWIAENIVEIDAE
jgi:hypothetical protein